MRGLPVNLASEPLEWRRRVRRVVGITALVVLTATAAHGLLAWSLLSASVPDSARAAAATDPTAVVERVRSWEGEVERIAGVAAPERVRATADAVDVANDVVARRAFPWGELFVVLEEALPDDVRLVQVQPVAAADGVRVDLLAGARERAALLEFLEALEQADRLREVFPVLQEPTPDGQWLLTVRARFAGPTGMEP